MARDPRAMAHICKACRRRRCDRAPWSRLRSPSPAGRRVHCSGSRPRPRPCRPPRGRPCSARIPTGSSRPRNVPSPLLQIEVVGCRIVGHQQVRLSVVVHIRKNRGHPVVRALVGNAGLFAHLGECPVAVVVKQVVRFAQQVLADRTSPDRHETAQSAKPTAVAFRVRQVDDSSHNARSRKQTDPAGHRRRSRPTPPPLTSCPVSRRPFRATSVNVPS